MATYSQATFDGNVINITSISPSKLPSTKKQRIGRQLVKLTIPGRNASDWRLRISGIIVSDLSNERAALENLDDANKYAYVDGIHDGDYVIETGSLVFKDDENSAATGTNFKYSMMLIQYQQ